MYPRNSLPEPITYEFVLVDLHKTNEREAREDADILVNLQREIEKLGGNIEITSFNYGKNSRISRFNNSLVGAGASFLLDALTWIKSLFVYVKQHPDTITIVRATFETVGAGAVALRAIAAARKALSRSSLKGRKILRDPKRDEDQYGD